MEELIIDKLMKRIIELRNPICVGLNTTPEVIPDVIYSKEISDRWKTFSAMREAIIGFNSTVIDIVKDIVPAVSINIAPYEKYGDNGMYAYMKTIEYAKMYNLLVIGDIKRGDSKKISKDYADSHIGRVNIVDISQPVYNEDFVTVNPYIGNVQPFIDNAEKYNKGVFLVAKTKDSDTFQDLMVSHTTEDIDEFGGQDLHFINIPLYMKVCYRAVKHAGNNVGTHNLSSIGIVMDSTSSMKLGQVRRSFPTLPIYVEIDDFIEVDSTLPAFREDKLGAVITMSDFILGAHKNPMYTGMSWHSAIEQAVIDIRNRVREGLGI